jgi:hypothetical protein
MKESVGYDVCIVGAGPHALAVLSALHTPVAPRLTEQQHKDRRGVRGRGKGEGSRAAGRKPSVCVVDPSGGWLHDWNERFAALDIEFLRSPSWAHPDAFSQEALLDFARREKRLNELRSVDFIGTSLQGTPEIDAGLFSLPGTKLFGDFCKQMTRSLPHTFVCGRVANIASVADGYELTVQTSRTVRPDCIIEASTSTYRAQRVVLALGKNSEKSYSHRLSSNKSLITDLSEFCQAPAGLQTSRANLRGFARTTQLSGLAWSTRATGGTLPRSQHARTTRCSSSAAGSVRHRLHPQKSIFSDFYSVDVLGH